MMVYLMVLLSRVGGNLVFAAQGDGLARGARRLNERLDNKWTAGAWHKERSPMQTVLGNAAAVFLSSYPHASTRGETAHHVLIVDEAQDQQASHIEAVFTPMRASTNAGAYAQKGDVTSCTHMELGYYLCPLSTTETGTLGRLRVAVHETGALPIWVDFLVMPANVYDSLLSTDLLQVHVNEMTNDIITAAVIAANAIDAGAIASDAFTAAKFASDVTTEFQTGLPTAATIVPMQSGTKPGLRIHLLVPLEKVSSSARQQPAQSPPPASLRTH